MATKEEQSSKEADRDGKCTYVISVVIDPYHIGKHRTHDILWTRFKGNIASEQTKRKQPSRINLLYSRNMHFALERNASNA